MKSGNDSVYEGSNYLENNMSNENVTSKWAKLSYPGVHEGSKYLEDEDEKVLNSSNNDDNNSWCVSTIEDFLHYCCPDCDVKIREQENFVRHALSAHPVSANYLGQLIVKEEFIVDKNDPEDDLGENMIGKNESEDYMGSENFEYSSNVEVDSYDSYYGAEESESLIPKKVNAYVVMMGSSN